MFMESSQGYGLVVQTRASGAPSIFIWALLKTRPSHWRAVHNDIIHPTFLIVYHSDSIMRWNCVFAGPDPGPDDREGVVLRSGP